MIFDTHAHYDDEAFDTDRDALIRSLPEHGIGCVIDVAASKNGQSRVKELADTYDFVYGALGMHPDEVGDFDDPLWNQIEEGLEDPKIVAVGEIGLDYHWNIQPHELQEQYFREQIALAKRHGLPILVHSRNAADDTLRIITDCYGKASSGASIQRKGIIHCYSYSYEQAKLYTDMGFYLGIGGVVTFKNSRKLKKVVTNIPLDHLLLETDCPYMAPEPNRGKRNSSLYLPSVVETIAELKGITPEEVEEVTWKNAVDLFQIRR